MKSEQSLSPPVVELPPFPDVAFCGTAVGSATAALVLSVGELGRVAVGCTTVRVGVAAALGFTTVGTGVSVGMLVAETSVTAALLAVGGAVWVVSGAVIAAIQALPKNVPRSAMTANVLYLTLLFAILV